MMWLVQRVFPAWRVCFPDELSAVSTMWLVRQAVAYHQHGRTSGENDRACEDSTDGDNMVRRDSDVTTGEFVSLLVSQGTRRSEFWHAVMCCLGKA